MSELDPTDVGDLNRRQTAIDRLLMAEGAGHIVHDLPLRADGRTVGLTSRPWRLDPIPYVIQADEFTWLEAAVIRRMQMLETVLDDLYGSRSLVADGLIDPAELWSSPRYRLAAVGAATRRHQRRWMSTYAVDVVRTADGVWFAIADHTDTPEGLGYSLLDRSVMDQITGGEAVRPRPIDDAYALVRRGLVDSTAVDGPRVVMLTSGIDHPAYVEHSYMATNLGFNVVEGSDLVVRDHELWLQTLGGLERVDVLYRRISDRQLDPLETNTFGTAGIPGVLLADEAGSLTMANSHGTGVLDDPFLVDLWDRAGTALTGEEPWLAMRSPTSRDRAGGSNAIDVVLGRPAERVDTFANGITMQQPMVLRLHAVATDAGIAVVPGGNGRVIESSDNPLVPSPCRAKDVWVLGEARSSGIADEVRSAPQVDFITSVPTRAADSLYWLGRASERAEVVARATRALISAVPAAGAPSPTPAMQLLRALAGEHGSDADESDDIVLDLAAARESAVQMAARSLEFHVGSMLAEAASVREFLSSTTGRVLGEMVATRDRLSDDPADIDALDALLFQLSAFGGLWSESVVRGPAWYFGDFAKRYERSVAGLTSAATAVRIVADTALTDLQRRRGLEQVLAANDSLVAYRRRYRSDVELDAVLSLLLLDDRNPRSVAASIATMADNAVAIGWSAGVERIVAVGDDVAAFDAEASADLLDAAVVQLHALATELTSTRLVAPPHPRLVRPRLIAPGEVA